MCVKTNEGDFQCLGLMLGNDTALTFNLQEKRQLLIPITDCSKTTKIQQQNCLMLCSN